MGIFGIFKSTKPHRRDHHLDPNATDLFRLLRSLRFEMSLCTATECVMDTACSVLAASSAVTTSWIVVFDEETIAGVTRREVTGYRGTNGEVYLSQIADRIETGNVCSCIERALVEDAAIPIHEDAVCNDCPGIDKMRDKSLGVLTRLEHDQEVFGLLVIWWHRRKPAVELSPTIISFAEEIAAEIADRLYEIALEADREHLAGAVERRRSEYEELYRNAPIGIMRTSFDGTLLEANRACADILGYGSVREMKTNIRNLRDDFYVRPAEREELVERLLNEQSVFDSLVEARRADGSVCWLSLDTSMIHGPEDTSPVLLSFLRDMTEQRNAYEELFESQERLDLAVHAAGVGVWDWDLANNTINVNDVWSRMLGYTDAGFGTIETEDWEVLVEPTDLTAAIASARAHIAGEVGLYEAEFRMCGRSNRQHWIRARGRITAWTPDNTPARVTGTHVDVTDAREREHRTKAEVRQKEVLLREIHHRVKNNLSVILSLLSLQSSRVDSLDAAIRAFESSAGRVRTIALIHELLYESIEVEEVPLHVLIERLVAGFRYSVPTSCATDVSLDLHPISINLDSAVPIVLSVQEVLSNAFEHGVSDREDDSQSLKLHVELSSFEAHGIVITIADGGPGMATAEQSGFGLTLVEALVDQVSGKLEIATPSNGDGTRCTLLFPPDVCNASPLIHGR